MPCIIKMENESEILEIVVSRFREPLDWLSHTPFNKYPVIVYNKSGDDNYYKSPKMKKEVILPNVGCEAHTYLYHIINNYDNLANITAFFQGSIEIPKKYSRAVNTVNKSVERNMTVIYFNEFNNIRQEFGNFTLDHYPFNHPTVINNTESNTLHPCRIRPFGEWYDVLFGDVQINGYSSNSIMAIKKEDILKRPKEFYEHLFSFVNEGIQPEGVHYMERVWAAIFHPLPNESLIH